MQNAIVFAMLKCEYIRFGSFCFVYDRHADRPDDSDRCYILYYFESIKVQELYQYNNYLGINHRHEITLKIENNISV